MRRSGPVRRQMSSSTGGDAERDVQVGATRQLGSTSMSRTIIGPA
jgi:hypothetical protein